MIIIFFGLCLNVTILCHKQWLALQFVSVPAFVKPFIFDLIIHCYILLNRITIIYNSVDFEWLNVYGFGPWLKPQTLENIHIFTFWLHIVLIWYSDPSLYCYCILLTRFTKPQSRNLLQTGLVVTVSYSPDSNPRRQNESQCTLRFSAFYESEILDN